MTTTHEVLVATTTGNFGAINIYYVEAHDAFDSLAELQGKSGQTIHVCAHYKARTAIGDYGVGDRYDDQDNVIGDQTAESAIVTLYERLALTQANSAVLTYTDTSK